MNFVYCRIFIICFLTLSSCPLFPAKKNCFESYIVKKVIKIPGTKFESLTIGNNSNVVLIGENKEKNKYIWSLNTNVPHELPSFNGNHFCGATILSTLSHTCILYQKEISAPATMHFVSVTNTCSNLEIELPSNTYAIAIAPDISYGVSVNFNLHSQNRISIFDIPNKKILCTVHCDMKGLLKLSLSHNKKLLVCSSDTIEIFDLQWFFEPSHGYLSMPPKFTINEKADQIKSVTFSHNGSYFFTGHQSGQIHLRDMRGYKLKTLWFIEENAIKQDLSHIALSKNEKYLAVAYGDGTIVVWEHCSKFSRSFSNTVLNGPLHDTIFYFP